MKNIQIALVMLLLFVGSNLHAQSKKYKTEGRKCTRVEIVTPGDLYSNYQMSDGDVEMMQIDGIKDFLIEKIKKNIPISLVLFAPINVQLLSDLEKVDQRVQLSQQSNLDQV